MLDYKLCSVVVQALSTLPLFDMIALKSVLEQIQGTSSFSYSNLGSPLSRSSSSSCSTSPDLGRPPYSSTKRRHYGHPTLWIVVGFVTSTLVFTVIFPRALLSPKQQYKTKESTCASLEEFSQGSGVSFGPPKTVLVGVGKNGVPGPKEVSSRFSQSFLFSSTFSSDTSFIWRQFTEALGELFFLLCSYSLLMHQQLHFLMDFAKIYGT